MIRSVALIGRGLALLASLLLASGAVAADGQALTMSVAGSGREVAVSRPVDGAPLDLTDRQPRSVGVTFEVSSSDQPGRTDAQYSVPFSAWLRPGKQQQLIEVVVPSRVVEEHLLREENPLPGSFSDFIWVFDVRSGEVVSASVSGTMLRTLNWGLTKTRTPVRIRVDMSTRKRAGFEPPVTILGQTFFRHCTKRASKRCTVVDAVPLDPSSGYVNAVGSMAVVSSVMRLRSFSPIGEAIFRELELPSLQAIAGTESLPQPELGATQTARAPAQEIH
jgi:hypothetical protein